MTRSQGMKSVIMRSWWSQKGSDCSPDISFFDTQIGEINYVVHLSVTDLSNHKIKSMLSTTR